MKAHGYADLSWYKNVLTMDIHGPFNDEGVMLSIKHMKKSVLNKNLKLWYRIEKLDTEAMGSPLTMEIVNEMYLWADNHGCRATAVVVSNLIQKKSIAGVLEGKNANVFHHIDEAQEWISQQ